MGGSVEPSGYPLLDDLRTVCRGADASELDIENMPEPYARFFIGRRVTARFLKAHQTYYNGGKVLELARTFAGVKTGPEYFIRLGELTALMDFRNGNEGLVGKEIYDLVAGRLNAEIIGAIRHGASRYMLEEER